MNHVAKFNAHATALEKISMQEALEHYNLEIDESLIDSLRVESDPLPHYHVGKPLMKRPESPVMLTKFHNSYLDYWKNSFQENFVAFRFCYQQVFSRRLECSLERLNKKLPHLEAAMIVVIEKNYERAFVIGDNNDIYNLEGESFSRLHRIIASAESNRSVKTRRRTKYTLDQLLAECDETAPMPKEFKDWDNMELVGLERGEGI